MPKQTPLYQAHAKAGGKFVDFGGWDLPIHYGSQLKEHQVVRENAGMFDVSHMTVVDLTGDRVGEFLQYLLANDAARIEHGQAMYSCMLNEQGGVIDDLIVYFMHDQWFRMVVNAGTREKDLAWIGQQAPAFDVTVNERDDLAMIAVQGPQARQCFQRILNDSDQAQVSDLKTFYCADLEHCFVARTGYTGEDGYEFMVAAEQAESYWDRLLEQGVQPCGLGARDTLRLEAGMCLYGSDMDETVLPSEANLSWTVALDERRDFIGKAALLAADSRKRLVGLVLPGKGVLRNHLPVFAADQAVGEITSGGFSPVLGQSIALARIDTSANEGISVEMRGKRVPVNVVRPIFVRRGSPCVKQL